MIVHLARRAGTRRRSKLDSQGREELERELLVKLGDAVPLPDRWGGYRVTPRAIEFWQGRSSRFHDRFLYRRVEEGWAIKP